MLFELGFFVAVVGASVYKPYNGLAHTPPMGWNNWATFQCNVSEELITSTANQIVKLGLRDVGYEYVVLDDCWSDGRDADGRLTADSAKFPSGMKSLATNIHDLGLKYGMYSSAGTWTCAGYEGSLGYEDVDAKTWADWGVDYLKYDNCFNSGQFGTPEASYKRYKKMSDALAKSGRSIVYSLCSWGEDSVWDWGAEIANSWRVAGDLYDSFDRPDTNCPCDDDEYICKLGGHFCSMMNVLNKAAIPASKSHAGAWGDLDILEVGHGGCSDEEYKTHFSMWALMKSPLMIGADLRDLSPEAYSILTNPAIIAINQDPLGSAVHRLWKKPVKDVDEYERGDISAWSGPLANGDRVVALLNAGARSRKMKVSLDEIFVDQGPRGNSKESKRGWDVYDLWANRMTRDEAKAAMAGNVAAQKIYNVTHSSYTQGLEEDDPRLFGNKVNSVEPHGFVEAKVEPHGVAVFRLRPAGVAEPKHEL